MRNRLEWPLRIFALTGLCIAFGSAIAGGSPKAIGVAKGLGPDQTAAVYSMNAARGFIGIQTVNGQKANTITGVTLMPGAHQLELYVWEGDPPLPGAERRHARPTIQIDVEAGHSYALQRTDDGGTSSAPNVKLYDLGAGRDCTYRDRILYCEGTMLLLYD